MFASKLFSLPMTHVASPTCAVPYLRLPKWMEVSRKRDRKQAQKTLNQEIWDYEVWEEVHVDESGDAFTLKVEKGRTLRMLEGKNHWRRPYGKSVTQVSESSKKVLEGRTLYKRKKDKIRPANISHKRRI